MDVVLFGVESEAVLVVEDTLVEGVLQLLTLGH